MPETHKDVGWSGRVPRDTTSYASLNEVENVPRKNLAPLPLPRESGHNPHPLPHSKPWQRIGVQEARGTRRRNLHGAPRRGKDPGGEKDAPADESPRGLGQGWLFPRLGGGVISQ